MAYALGFETIPFTKDIELALDHPNGNPTMDYETMFTITKPFSHANDRLRVLQPSITCATHKYRNETTVSAIARKWSRKQVPGDVTNTILLFYHDLLVIKIDERHHMGRIINPPQVKQLFNYEEIITLFQDSTPMLRKYGKIMVLNNQLMHVLPIEHAKRFTPIIMSNNTWVEDYSYLKVGIAQPLNEEAINMLIDSENNRKCPPKINVDESESPLIVIYYQVCAMHETIKYPCSQNLKNDRV